MDIDEQTKKLFACRRFVVRTRQPRSHEFLLMCHFAKRGKTLQEFLVFLAKDQPHLKATPFWADGGSPAVEIHARPGEQLCWKMPVAVHDEHLIGLLAERIKLDARIAEAAEGPDSVKRLADAEALARDFVETYGGSDFRAFLFLKGYELAGRGSDVAGHEAFLRDGADDDEGER